MSHTKIRTTIICSLLLALTIFPQFEATAASTLFFYNPESNINDFRSLKKLFDVYLSRNGAYQFQPFDKKNTFEEFLKKHKNDVFLLSSWHYQNLREQGYSNLKPILVGTINGDFTYTKILSTKKKIKNMKQLLGKRVASAGNKNYTKNMLNNMAAQQQLNLSFNILTVPKDIDALMSVLFGMAQGALTARHSLKTLATINPRKHRLLHQITESQPIMLPVVVAYGSATKISSNKLLDAIENLPSSSAGKEILGMLGWNGWKKITQAEMQF
jgi:hypothetical protein